MSVIQTLVEICLLRGKPQDLPASPSLVWQTALLSIVSNFVIDNLHPSMTVRLLFATTQAGLLGAVVWGALRLRRHPERWMQTVSPLYTAGALINLIAWPIFTYAIAPNVPGSDNWAMVIGVGMTVWFLAIMTHVLHHALELSVGRSAAVSIVCMMFSGMALLLLFPMAGIP